MEQPRYNLSRLKNKTIAIDGPAGSGKSTTAKLLAARLGYRYLDTGAMYRALTWFAAQNGVAPSDGPRLRKLAEALIIAFETLPEVNKVFINGQEVTDNIRTPMVTELVSEVSAHPGVRLAMVTKQRELAQEGGVVAEGRDTTTVVFPDADVKVYMDSSPKTRAERRLIDLAKLGVSTSLEELEADIKRRDDHDSGREHSPLRKAKDAYQIDTTNMTIEEQVDKVFGLLKAVLK